MNTSYSGGHKPTPHFCFLCMQAYLEDDATHDATPAHQEALDRECYEVTKDN